MVYGEADDLAHCNGYGNKVNNAEKCKAYYHANQEKRKESMRSTYWQNREEILARRRKKYRAKNRPWEVDEKVSAADKAMDLVMEAKRSPYTKVNDDGDLHPHEGDGYAEDQEPEGVVWIASRPDPILVGRDKYSYQPWVDIVLEAQDRVYLLVQKGHARARAVIDLQYEMALACDGCGLWSAIGHRSPKDRFSTEYESGALIVAESCDPGAVHKLFGKAFDPLSAYDREQETDYGDTLRDLSGEAKNKKRREAHAAAAKKRRG